MIWICEVSWIIKNENLKKKKISVIYNNETKKESLINENEQLKAILIELRINEEVDYNFYYSNNNK